MPLDLIGKLHRTIYIEGCLSTVREDLIRLLVSKCGPIEGWDVVGDRIIIIFSSVNSISTALTFNNTAFGDLTTKLIIWVANQSPPAGVTQLLTITGGNNNNNNNNNSNNNNETGGQRTAEEVKAAREIREKRLATIREVLATDIAKAEIYENTEIRWRDLCARQLSALCILTQHTLNKMEKSLEEATLHLNGLQATLSYLREEQEQKNREEEEVINNNYNNYNNMKFTKDLFINNKDDVKKHVETFFDGAEDISTRRVRRRGD